MEQLGNINQINRSIMHGNLTNEQLESIISAVKFARAQLANNTKRSLCVGNTIKFSSAKLGTHIGQVEKIAIKYITIRTSQGLYKVPANMVEVV